LKVQKCSKFDILARVTSKNFQKRSEGRLKNILKDQKCSKFDILARVISKFFQGSEGRLKSV
jgi:hypothetical protein